MAQTNYTPLTWSIALLKRLNSPVNHQTVQAVLGWVNAEGGNWHNDAKFNPLNTTMPAPGAGNTGSQGNIKVYTSWNQGLDATVRTLKNGLYSGILGALKQGKSAGAVGSAITASPWGTGGLAARVIAGTRVPANLPNVQPVAQPVTAATSPAHTAGTPATTRTVTTDPNQAARGAAIRSFLFDKSIQPTDFASQVSALQPVTTKITTPASSPTPTLKQPNANPRPQPQTSSVGGVLPADHSKLFELIHNTGSGPGFGVKNGQIVNGSQVFSGVWAGHRDHVHVAAGPNTIVAVGKIAQKMGLHVGENPHFGGVNPVHVPGSYHYKGEAIDVSGPDQLMNQFARRVEQIFGLK